VSRGPRARARPGGGAGPRGPDRTQHTRKRSFAQTRTPSALHRNKLERKAKRIGAREKGAPRSGFKQVQPTDYTTHLKCRSAISHTTCEPGLPVPNARASRTWHTSLRQHHHNICTRSLQRPTGRNNNSIPLAATPCLQSSTSPKFAPTRISSRLRSHYLTEGRTRVKPGEHAASPSGACGCSSHATPQRTTRPSTVAYARPTPATAQATPPHEEPTPLDTTQATNARERSRPVSFSAKNQPSSIPPRPQTLAHQNALLESTDSRAGTAGT
jgi:hypothetical protein